MTQSICFLLAGKRGFFLSLSLSHCFLRYLLKNCLIEDCFIVVECIVKFGFFKNPFRRPRVCWWQLTWAIKALLRVSQTFIAILGINDYNQSIKSLWLSFLFLFICFKTVCHMRNCNSLYNFLKITEFCLI